MTHGMLELEHELSHLMILPSTPGTGHRAWPAAYGDSGEQVDLPRLGQALRSLRRRYGWTRADVARLSEGRWTATALGTYERGERMMTAVGLFALADFYRVPVADLLDRQRPEPPRREPETSIMIDVWKLEQTTDWPQLARFVDAVVQARADQRRRLLTLRSRDLPRLAAIHGESVETFLEALRRDTILAAQMS